VRYKDLECFAVREIRHMRRARPRSAMAEMREKIEREVLRRTRLRHHNRVAAVDRMASIGVPRCAVNITRVPARHRQYECTRVVRINSGTGDAS